MTRTLFAAALLLAACAGPEEESPVYMELPEGVGDCGAERFQQFVGTKVADMALPDELMVRVIEPGMAVTKDYRPSRMNVHVDDEGTITQIICG